MKKILSAIIVLAFSFGAFAGQDTKLATGASPMLCNLMLAQKGSTEVRLNGRVACYQFGIIEDLIKKQNLKTDATFIFCMGMEGSAYLQAAIDEMTVAVHELSSKEQNENADWYFSQCK